MPAHARLLPPPEPYQGSARCRTCAGAKVTGERYVFSTSDEHGDLLVDEICGACLGCGRAEHDGCRPEEHAERDDDDDRDPALYDEEGEPCPSCHGQRWWVAQGYTETEVRYLRVPCGCAADLLVEVGRT